MSTTLIRRMILPTSLPWKSSPGREPHQDLIALGAWSFALTDFSKDYDKLKTDPADVATAALQAVADGVEDVYPGEEAQ